MKVASRVSTAAFLAPLVLGVFGQCRRQEAAREAPRSTVTAASADAAGVFAAPPARPPVAADVTADAASPDGGDAPPSTGDWLDGAIYRFRLDAIRRCAPAPSPVG